MSPLSIVQRYIAAGLVLAVLVLGGGWYVDHARGAAKIAKLQAQQTQLQAALTTARQNESALQVALDRQTAAVRTAQAERTNAQARLAQATAAGDELAGRLHALQTQLAGTPLPADPTDAIYEHCRRMRAILEEAAK